MKSDKQIHIFNGRAIEFSEQSIFHPNNLEKLNFIASVVGNSKEGFSLYSLPKDNYECVILNTHGTNVQSRLFIDTNEPTDFNAFLMSVLSINSSNRPLELIITSCYGKNAHNHIDKLSEKLPKGSKIITFADFNQTHIQGNEIILNTKKLNAEINFFTKNNLKFFDLLLLYCLNKIHTYEVPTVGVQTEKGYKFLSLDQVLTIPPSIDVDVIDNLKSLFENSIISKEKMASTVQEFNNTKSNERTKSELFQMIETKTPLKLIIETVEKAWYFEGDLKNVDTSEQKNNEFLEYGAKISNLVILLNKNNIQDTELILDMPRIKKAAAIINKDREEIDKLHQETIGIINQSINGSILTSTTVTLTDFLLSCYDINTRKLINQEKLRSALEILKLLGIDDELSTEELSNLYDSLLDSNSLLTSYKSIFKILCNISHSETLITNLIDEPPLTKNDYLHIVAANMLAQSENIEQDFYSSIIGNNLFDFNAYN